MRCKNCRFWQKGNGDSGYCKEISGDIQREVLAVMPVYDGNSDDIVTNSVTYEKWIERTDLERLRTGAHFGCVHFEPKKH